MVESKEDSRHESGSLSEVAVLAWPIIISMLSYTAMGVADTLFVGWLGKAHLGAVGLGTTAIFLINAFFTGTLSSVKIVSAQAKGAGDLNRAREAVWGGLVMTIPMVLFVFGLSLFSEEIFSLMGGTPRVQSMAREYFEVRVWGAPFMYPLNAICHYYQGLGDTKTPMKVNILANMLNIVFDVILIFGWGPIPAMGVKGAALGTVMAFGVGTGLLLWLFWRKEGFKPVWSPKTFKEVVTLGLPIGVNYLMNTGSFAIFTAILARMGEVELAANQIAYKILSMSFLPGYGFSEAACVLVGQYVGAKKWEMARRSFTNSLILAVSVMGVCGLVFWLIPEPLLRLFIDDEEVIAVGVPLLYIAALFQILDAVAMVAAGALNGAGDTRFTMVSSVLASWFLMLPGAYYFGVVAEMGAAGGWIGVTMEIGVLGVITMWRWRRLSSKFGGALS